MYFILFQDKKLPSLNHMFISEADYIARIKELQARIDELVSIFLFSDQTSA